MKRKESNLERKIKESLEYFKKAYMKRGYFRMDYGKGLGTENSPDYYEALDGKGYSKIVGNSSFAPRVRRVPVYLNNEDKYMGWQIPHHYRWVLSIHPKLADGIKDRVSPKDMTEISIEPRNMSNEEILDMIKDFLMLSNEDVMRKFRIDRSIFSKESLEIMKKVDRRNELMRKTEKSVIEFSDFELQIKRAAPKRILEDKIIC